MKAPETKGPGETFSVEKGGWGDLKGDFRVEVYSKISSYKWALNNVRSQKGKNFRKG
jgi:hypothetical protein